MESNKSLDTSNTVDNSTSPTNSPRSHSNSITDFSHPYLSSWSDLYHSHDYTTMHRQVASNDHAKSQISQLASNTGNISYFSQMIV